MRIFRILAFVGFAAIAAVQSAFADDAPPSASGRHKTTGARKLCRDRADVCLDPRNGRARGLLLVEIGLDVKDAALRDRVNNELPILRDAYVRSLLVFAATAVKPWRQPNVEEIATRMQAITDRVLGKPGARVLMAQTAIRITR